MNNDLNHITPRRTAILFGFAAPLMFFIFCWNLPYSMFSEKVRSISNYVMHPLGLYQNWRMFAGDNSTTHHTFFIRLKYVYEDRSHAYDPDYDFKHPGYSRSVKRGVSLNALVQWPGTAWRDAMLHRFCQTSAGRRPKWVVLEMARIPVVKMQENPERVAPLSPNRLVPGGYTEESIHACF